MHQVETSDFLLAKVRPIISVGFNLKQKELGHSRVEKAKVISDNSQQD